MTSTKVQWRVQVKAKTGAWINKGLFETRDAARERCAELRGGFRMADGRYVFRFDEAESALGFGRTRVVRYVRGEK